MASKIHAVELFSDGSLMGGTRCGRLLPADLAQHTIPDLPFFVDIPRARKCGSCQNCAQGMRVVAMPAYEWRAVAIPSFRPSLYHR
jgi:hypothetical protein